MQAKALADFLSNIKVDRIISSPFLRAIQTIKPFAEKMDLDIETDSRLTERVLSSMSFPDWLEKLETTFEDMDLKYEGGESSNEAQNRIVGVVNDILASDSEHILIVAHGGIISLLLCQYDQNFGFEQWKKLSNPDVYLVRILQKDCDIKRLWMDRSF